MSAPTPAPGDDRPREGYYPDPSIPGYVRYWNGASWVAGTSRPAPKDGEPLAPPPGARPSVEETGPHFFDEDPVEDPPPAAAQHGSRPESAAAWGADRSGPADAPEQRVAWPGPARGADPRVPHTRQPAPAAEGAAEAGGQGDAAASAPAPASASPAAPAPAPGPGPASAPASASASASASGEREAESQAGNTFVFRRPSVGQQGTPAPGGAPAPAEDEGTMTFRAVPPRTGPQSGGPGAPSGTGSGSGPGFGAGKAAAARAAAAQTPVAQTPAAQTPAPQAPAAPAAPSVPHQASPPQPAPAAPAAPVAAGGPGGGQASWAQQVHRLAGAGGDEQPVAPWKPPVEDVFQAAARRQAAARPAGLGKRLAARLIDTVVLAGVTAVAAVPLGMKAADHVNDKIDQAKLSGETVTVWLLDGTTSTYLGIVLAVLLLFGVVYEALPTAKWGRTPGKKLLGLEVRDIEAHESPSFGAALRRWLVYSVPGLLVVGVVGIVWCLFDRPWHQCWHDKAAGTFVAG
ncbi:RDD family protein [Streptomyces sp. CCM_MD2014]|uniref:RDD family protein n=1 Tax=Streptomyces sp. CCM_MD2014 TaxID=1561022 RepID=UPI00052AF29A|nr:RDD family protein [Streptomyces sp. CCM_MD2014]AIV36186.1 membrane protein [Streptomyces sp. CCM_MD2014]